MLNTLPSTFSNVFVDAEGTAYSTCMGKGTDLLKKHSTNGTNLFKNVIASSDAFTDVIADSNDELFMHLIQRDIYMYIQETES